MKKLITAAFMFAGLMTSQAQVVFLEDFDGIPGSTAGGAGTYSFPAGWSLFNVDNATPATNVAYVNAAWERREDFNFNVADSAAFSTSWYSPAGTANDWMFTPAITIPANSVLSWNAVAYDASYPDGYQVRIMTAAPTTGNITTSTVLQTITAENSTWTARTQNLSAYAGQTVYIGFRNNSVDMFLLVIDDIKVEVMINYDAQLLAVDTISEYTVIPESHVEPFVLGGDIKNNGSSALTNVKLNVDIRNSANASVYSASSATANIASGATASFTIPSFTPTTPDVYTVWLYSNATEADQMTSNDTISRTIIISDTIYARDNGNVTGSLGIGAGVTGYIGQDFEVVNADDLTSVSAFFNRGYTGKKYAFAVWNMAAGVPSTIVAATDTMLYPNDSARFVTVPIYGGSINLAPGRYAVTAIEFDSTLALGQTSEKFTTNRTWVYWSTSPLNGWGNNEDFGASFAKSYVLRANFGCVAVSSTQTLSICAGSSVTVGTSTYTASGTYTDVLTAVNGCDSVVTTNLTVAPAIDVTTSTASNVITANSTSGTFQWIDCNNNNAVIAGETNQNFTATANGSYAVIVTNGTCSDTSACVNITGIGVNELSSRAISVYPNPSAGNFMITANEAGVYTIFNEVGQEVQTFELSVKNNFSVSVNNLSNGVYMISGVNSKNVVKQRIVVTK